MEDIEPLDTDRDGIGAGMQTMNNADVLSLSTRFAV